MKENSPCESFQDFLDRPAAGARSPQEERWLEEHATGCADCAMLLRIRDHLASPKMEMLARDLPEEIDAQMWRAVEEHTRPAASARRPARELWRWAGLQRWLAPLCGAALLVLLVGNLLLVGELRQIHRRERELTSQLAWLEARRSADDAQLAGGAVLGDPQGPAAAGRGVRHPIGTSWSRWLPKQEFLTAAQLRAQLTRIPSGMTLLSRRDTETLLEDLAARRPLTIGALRAEVQTQDGLQAGEALTLLEQLLPDAERVVSRAQLRDAARRLNRGIAL